MQRPWTDFDSDSDSYIKINKKKINSLSISQEDKICFFQTNAHLFIKAKKKKFNNSNNNSLNRYVFSE